MEEKRRPARKQELPASEVQLLSTLFHKEFYTRVGLFKALVTRVILFVVDLPLSFGSHVIMNILLYLLLFQPLSLRQDLAVMYHGAPSHQELVEQIALVSSSCLHWLVVTVLR